MGDCNAEAGFGGGSCRRRGCRGGCGEAGPQDPEAPRGVVVGGFGPGGREEAAVQAARGAAAAAPGRRRGHVRVVPEPALPWRCRRGAAAAGVDVGKEARRRVLAEYGQGYAA